MKSRDDLLNSLSELKYSIMNSDFRSESVFSSLQKFDSDLTDLKSNSMYQKNNIIKSFLITFNISCFSDFTILFLTSSDQVSIIEYAGNKHIFNEVNNMFDQEINFYKDMDKLDIGRDYFRIYYESMETDNGIYTLMTLTESALFKPSKFHMVGDILMDIIRSGDRTDNSVIEDLFENAVVQLNTFINNNTIIEPELYLFIFENIQDFFLEVGFEILLEISETIKKNILEVFGNKSGIVALSLSRYIVISPENSLSEEKIIELKNRTLIDFSYKGIVLQYNCIRVPYNKNNSIYDIIENIFPISNIISNSKTGD